MKLFARGLSLACITAATLAPTMGTASAAPTSSPALARMLADRGDHNDCDHGYGKNGYVASGYGNHGYYGGGIGLGLGLGILL